MQLSKDVGCFALGVFLMGKTKENNANIVDKSKRKLLVTGSTFPRWEGDTEPRFIFDYAEAMTEYYDVTVLVPAAPGAKDFEKMSNVNVVRYHYFPVHRWETLCYPGAIVPRIKEKKIRIFLVPFLFLSLYLHLKKMLPEYDIVHAHWLIPQGIVQSFFQDKPYIVTGHGGDVTSLNKGILRKLKIRCLKNAQHVTVVSEHLRGRVQELLPEISPSVISMGVNTKNFGQQYRVANYFGQGDKKVVLFVGRLAEKKGVAYLIEAMKQIDALLVIVGDGTLRDELQQQANMLEKGKIRFLGGKTHKELKTIYASSDIFVVPSITAKDGDQEGFGLVMLEAMASGLPIVASRSGGIPQLIDDGINGMLCEEKCVWQIADNICSLLNDKNLYKSIVKNGYQTIRKYDYSKIAEDYYKILDDISLERIAVRNFET